MHYEVESPNCGPPRSPRFGNSNGVPKGPKQVPAADGERPPYGVYGVSSNSWIFW